MYAGAGFLVVDQLVKNREDLLAVGNDTLEGILETIGVTIGSKPLLYNQAGDVDVATQGVAEWPRRKRP